MEKSVSKTVVLQGVKAGLFSVVFSCAGVLLLALFAKLFGFSQSVLPAINQVLKAVAVILGTAVAVKDEKFVPKALLGATVFWLGTLLLFLALGGGFRFGQIMLDLCISVIVALIVAMLKSRRA